MTSSDALATLARYRHIGARESATVLKLGKSILGQSTGKVAGLGDSEWTIREQVAVAALDLGDLEYASHQITILAVKFRTSPRLALLKGMEMEARGDYNSAEIIYRDLLQDDECNVAAHQRLITMSLYGTPAASSSSASFVTVPTQPSLPIPTTTQITKTIPLLVKYLTVFQTDPAGWSLLSDLYVTLSGYTVDSARPFGWLVDGGLKKEGGKNYLEQAMNCVGQRMGLDVSNWMVLCRYGELGLLNDDIPMAYKTFLRAVEMSSDWSSQSTSPIVKPASTGDLSLESLIDIGGWQTKPWWLLKVCTILLLAPGYTPNPNSLSIDHPPEHVEAIDALINERLDALVGLTIREKGVDKLKTLLV